MAIFDLDFFLQQGSFTLSVTDRSDCRALALFGPSGSGKTSIVEVIAGLRTPSRGTVCVGNRVLFSDKSGINLPARFRGVGYVPQDVLLFPHLDTRENIIYGCPKGTVAIERLAETVEFLNLNSILDRQVSSLSGGERQRVALARALLSDPDVLLLDEPMAAVDLPHRRRILQVLLRIRDELEIPLVYVAHAPDEIATIAEHVLVLDQGTLTTAGLPSEVLPKQAY